MEVRTKIMFNLHNYLTYLVDSWERGAITADELARELRKVVNEEQAVNERLAQSEKS